MTTYTIKVIDNPADPTFNQLLGINETGEIAGYYGSGAAGHPNKGYTTSLSNPTVFTPENFPLSAQTQVTGLNDAGSTVGFEVDAAGNSFGFVDINGEYTLFRDPLAPVIGGVVNEQMLGINDSGLAVGFYQYDAAGDTRSFIYNSASHAYVGLALPGTSSTATGIDQRGDVSGFLTNNGKQYGFVRLATGGYAYLTGRVGWSNIQALGVNDAGLVVGSFQNSAGNTFGFTYDINTKTYQTFNYGKGVETVLNGVNDKGQIVGFYVDVVGHTNGLVLQPPAPTFNWTFQTLDDTADPTFNQLLSINNAGEIAGYFGSGATGHPNQGYLLQNEKTFTLLNFPGSVQTQETGINNAAATVGFEVDAAGNSLGFYQRAGSFQAILDPNAPTIGGVVSEQLLGLNDLGQMAGFYVDDSVGDTTGFIYNQNTNSFTNVSIAGAKSVTATDINDSGWISGFYTNTADDTLGFLQEGSKTITIKGGIGATDVQALGLNNNNLVVGSFVDTAGNTEGFVYQIDTATFNPIVAPGAATSTVLNGVNDLNQITGFYTDAGGNTHGLLVSSK